MGERVECRFYWILIVNGVICCSVVTFPDKAPMSYCYLCWQLESVESWSPIIKWQIKMTSCSLKKLGCWFEYGKGDETWSWGNAVSKLAKSNIIWLDLWILNGWAVWWSALCFFSSTCIVDNITKEVSDSRTGCTEAATSAEMLLELIKLKKSRCEVHCMHTNFAYYMYITLTNTLH